MNLILNMAKKLKIPMKDRGAIVEQVVRKSGVKLTTIRDRLKINYGTIYNWFSYPQLEWEHIERIGRVIGHDFRVEFPDMPVYLEVKEETEVVGEPKEDYGYDPLKRQVKETDMWRNKYIQLLEKYNELLKNAKS